MAKLLRGLSFGIVNTGYRRLEFICDCLHRLPTVGIWNLEFILCHWYFSIFASPLLMLKGTSKVFQR